MLGKYLKYTIENQIFISIRIGVMNRCISYAVLNKTGKHFFYESKCFDAAKLVAKGIRSGATY